jgi:hypothetical protein
MEENNQVLPDTLEPVVEDEPLELFATTETVNAAETAEVIEKNKKLFARAKAAEAKLKELKNGAKERAEAPAVNSAPQQDDIETVLQMRAEGYSDKEVLTLRSYAKRMNTPIHEVAKDPFIMSGILAEREKARSLSASPSPSTQPFVGKTGKSYKDMTSEERKEHFADITAKFRKGGRANLE